MDEVIHNPGITTRHDGLAVSKELTGEVFTRRVITVVLAAITALTFAFGFGNVWALGRSLGVPPFVAPLVGPAVDLSVAGLLIGIRHLSMAGVPHDQLRPARILLTACGAATLALNIAGPVTAGAYGRAAFDSVGPGLLIGWAETGPGMLRSLYSRPRNLDPALPGSEARLILADEELPAVSVPPLNDLASEDADPGRPGASQAGWSGRAGLDELLGEARRIDQAHHLRHHRPVSAETLRKELRIGSMRARALVQQVRGSYDSTSLNTEAPGRAPQQMGSDRAGTSEDRQQQGQDLVGELAAVALVRTGRRRAVRPGCRQYPLHQSQRASRLPGASRAGLRRILRAFGPHPPRRTAHDA